MAKRGSKGQAAKRFMAKSKQARRGPANPARQRQPKRMGSGPMMDAKAKSASRALRGPDKGTG